MSTPLFILSCPPGCLWTAIHYFKNTSGIKGKNKKRNKRVVGDKCTTNPGAFASEMGKMSGAGGGGGVRFFQSSGNSHRHAWSQEAWGHWQLCSGGVLMGNGASSRSAVHLMIPHSVAVTRCEFSPPPCSTYTMVFICSTSVLLFWRIVWHFWNTWRYPKTVEITALSENSFTFGCW